MIHVALNHVSRYRYDRRISLSPQIVRLRPAPHCRTRVLSYSLDVAPRGHFINWQQDPFSNYLARLVFPEKTQELLLTVKGKQVDTVSINDLGEQETVEADSPAQFDLVPETAGQYPIVMLESGKTIGTLVVR